MSWERVTCNHRKDKLLTQDKFVGGPRPLVETTDLSNWALPFSIILLLSKPQS